MSSADRGRRSQQLRIEGVSKRYGSVVAVENMSLTVERGILLSLLGPSGCGKTTTLRIVAGFEAPDTGCVVIGGRDVSLLPPNKRDLGMVFQNYSLFPHMTVGENIAFGLTMRKVAKDEIAKRISEMLMLVQLPGYEDRFPAQLSGGQRQRVALARSLVTNPCVLLLDEPLGALDKNLREAMQFELRRIQKTLDITTILVTHDQEEALTLSDRVIVMNQGQILQVGAPSDIYDWPRTRFVSEFLGTSNIFEGEVVADVGNGLRRFVLTGGRTQHDVLVAVRNDRSRAAARLLAVRPEKMRLTAEPRPEENVLPATIVSHVFRGSYHAYEVTLPDRATPIFVYTQALSRQDGQVLELGREVRLAWHPNDSILLEEDH